MRGLLIAVPLHLDATMGPMIALLHSAPAFGAVEHYVLTLATALAERGEQVTIIHPDVPELEPFTSIAGVRSEPIGHPFPATPRLVVELARKLRGLRPDIVHVTDVSAPALVAARLARPRRLIVTHHTPELPRSDNLAGKAWVSLGWLARPEIVYTSEHDRRTDGRRFQRTHVVPLGIDSDRFLAPPRAARSAAPVIGNVARLAPQKGQRTLIEAAPHVLVSHPDATFVIVGDGELRDELQRVAQDLGVAESFTFTGARDDIPELLATFDVFAFPSHFEGLCLAVIEAQVAGVPVVATPVGGIRETVVPNETGLLVEPGEPEVLAAAIVSLLDDPAYALRLASEAQRRALARYTERELVDRTLDLYAQG
jgi:glycosyltransferase involved in cell wall biosynthesis